MGYKIVPWYRRTFLEQVAPRGCIQFWTFFWHDYQSNYNLTWVICNWHKMVNHITESNLNVENFLLLYLTFSIGTKRSKILFWFPTYILTQNELTKTNLNEYEIWKNLYLLRNSRYIGNKIQLNFSGMDFQNLP